MKNDAYKSQEELLEELVKQLKDLSIYIKSTNKKVDLGVMDVPDVVANLHISPKTLRNWTAKGILRCTKIEGRVFYKIADIKAMFNEHFERQ